MPVTEHLQHVLDELIAAGAAGALLHYRDQDGCWYGSSGVAELGTGRQVDPAGHFRIGSVTKTFTATVVLQLVGEGVLSVDDPIDRWLPGLVPDGDEITLGQLLNHTSGIQHPVRPRDRGSRPSVVRDGAAAAHPRSA
ncbi:serine hydrolase [Kribbella flavida]|uniref:serine hydrolase n=1 Tax=Kribbella flavida TaxID=182640 RepID=UPI0011D27CC7